jgi:type II secretory pathway component PulM
VLKRNAKPVRTADLRSAVEQAGAARGLANLLTSIDASEGRVRVTFAAVDVDALAPFIEALGRDELLFVREATLVARVEPGTVRAELTLARPDTR